MIKYKQTSFGNGEDGTEPGNCFATCVAAIMELPQEEVPNFVKYDDWFAETQNFLAKYGYSLVIIDAGHKENYFMHTGYAIAAGMAERGLRHCVVYNQGQPVLDPHPDNTYLEEVDKWYLFAALNPANPCTNE